MSAARFLSFQPTSPTSLLTDDDATSCLNTSSTNWNALVRFPKFPHHPGEPIELLGQDLVCDFRHILVMFQTPVSTTDPCAAPLTVCKVNAAATCEIHCESTEEYLMDLRVYVRGEAGATLCEVTSNSLLYL
jgi:hypothetical protein